LRCTTRPSTPTRGRRRWTSGTCARRWAASTWLGWC
jgi:hypothetical protein